MTQRATVIGLLPGGFAQVAVARESACGGSCGSCGGCGTKPSIQARALNPLGAVPGDLVEVSTRSRQILGTAVLVYLLPIVFFFAGYALSAALGLPESASIATSIGALLLGVGVYTLLGRTVLKKRQFDFTITTILKETRDG